MTVVCDRCGDAYGIGQSPWCPHAVANGVRVADVTWPGGKTFENLGHDPVTFYDKSSYQTYLKTHGIEEFVRHQPVPGTDKSPHTTNWATVSAETLAGLKTMLERVGREQDAKASYLASMTVETTEETATVVGERGVFDAT